MFDFNSIPPMFPTIARKSPGSLYLLSKTAAVFLVKSFLNRHPIYHGHPWPFQGNVHQFRRFFRQRLPAHILTDILSTIIPRDKWLFPCVDTKDRLNCKIHWECNIVFNRMEQLLQLLFSEDISDLQFSLKKIRVNDYHMIIARLSSTLTKLPTRQYPNLRILKITGGTVHSDDLVNDIEELVENLKVAATNLTQLHLPVVSNVALRSCSDMPSLKDLKSDRTKAFNSRGLSYLADQRSKTYTNLEILHLGVFKHANFDKQSVADFLKKMRTLRDFSLLDSDRSLVEQNNGFGEKVLTYSSFKRAILECEEASLYIPPTKRQKAESDQKEEVEPTHQEKEEATYNEWRKYKKPPTFVTDLVEIRVVDRLLKPHYILESAPKVSRLHIDWQEGLSLPPFDRYPANWFPEMLKKPSWGFLSNKLVYLNITFPSAHEGATGNAYGLPLEDYTRLFQNLPNLESLKLVGAGMEGPLPLIPTLKYCSKLTELILEKTPVHVPDVYDVIDSSYVSRSLKKFYFVGEMSSLLVHDFLPRGIAYYMPELVELEVQPQTVMGYGGLFPLQVKELSRLKKLQRLSVPLSIRECIMNMPEVVYVLREFDSLRNLILSWGMWHESYDISKGKISYLMAWLFNALEAENANIYLQLCYKQHQNLFSNPVAPKMY